MADQLYYKIVYKPGPREFSGRVEMHLSRKREEVEIDEPQCMSRAFEYGPGKKFESPNQVVKEWNSEMLSIYQAIQIY